MSLSEIDGERVKGQKTGEIETRGRNEAIKGSEGRSGTARLRSGRTGRTEALEFFQHSLMGPPCPTINHCEMEKGQRAGADIYIYGI